MEKDSPRKQTVEEVQHQFEARLREAIRQRTVVEAELESSSERWRTERRRLNAEVDRLEAALAETKNTGKKSIGGKNDRGIDPLDFAKTQGAEGDSIRKASQVWEAERDKLLKEVSRLQRAVGELLERSNNPIRNNMPMREELETKLNHEVRARERVEAGYLREKAVWDEEKLRMTGELIKLRHLATQVKPLRGKPGVDERAKELEIRIGSMQKEMDRERAEWRTQIQQKERRLSETRKPVNPNVTDQLRRQYNDRIQEMVLEKARLTDELKRASALLESQSRQSVNADVVAQLRRQYDDRIQEMILQKTQLTDELKRASALLESERGRFMTATVSDKSENTAAIHAEVARVQQMIQEIGRRIDDPSTDLSTVIRKNVERAELSAYLKGIQYSTGNSKGI